MHDTIAPVSTARGPWALAGFVAGAAGLATSYCVAMVMTIHDAPVPAVAERVVRLTPGAVAERAIRYLGYWNKTFLIVVILVLLAAIFAWAGWLARRAWWRPMIAYAVLAAIGSVAVAFQPGSTTLDQVPVLVGLATWLVFLPVLTGPLRRADRTDPTAPTGEGYTAPTRQGGEGYTAPTRQGGEGYTAPGRGEGHGRRQFLLRTGLVVVGSAAAATVGRVVGRGRRHVEEARRLVRLPGITAPRTPRGVRVGLDGITPWVTSVEDFYRVDTAIVVPTIDPADWTLRIHGMVERELVLSYAQLIARAPTEAWATLSCVSNPVGGDLVGNAWWSGVALADLLEEAGVRPGADAVLQTAQDGWTCGTPLSALTDGRNALLAVAMNGEPLTIEHGFPARTVVPGLYGYVSACKWVVDMEVTRFADIEAYWTERGWSERGPVKMASRIDVPRGGEEVLAGGGRVGGVAWAQHTGIEAVEYAVDEGPWQRAELGRAPNADTWVQWAATIWVEPGDHTLAVRAIDRTGLEQTGAEQDVVPDGATGWHRIEFTAVEELEEDEDDE